MNVETTKLEILQMLLNIKELSVLQKVKELFETQSKEDWWEGIAAHEQVEVYQGLKDLEQEELVPHDEVMKIFKK